MRGAHRNASSELPSAVLQMKHLYRSALVPLSTQPTLNFALDSVGWTSVTTSLQGFTRCTSSLDLDDD